MEKLYSTYGLIDPRDGRLFYVGYSCKLRNRLKAHGCDTALSSYSTARSIRDARLEVGYVVFGAFPSRLDARRLERILVKTLPNLDNSPSPVALLSEPLYPIGADDLLLRANALRLAAAMQDWSYPHSKLH